MPSFMYGKLGMRRKLPAIGVLGVVAIAMTLTGCSESTDSPGGPVEVVLVTHDSFNVSKSVLAEFEKRNNLKVVVRSVGDAGTLANQLVFTKDAPLGDVVFGVDNTYASRVLEHAVISSTSVQERPSSAKAAPDEYQVDDTNRLHPVDYSEVCVNIDNAYFAERGLAEPATLEDLIKPEYKDLLVVENPAASSPGLAFLIGTISALGEESYLDYWSKLKANGVKVTEDWTTAYSVDFSGSSGRGPRPLVVSYLSSPYVEVIDGVSVPPNGVLTQTCSRQVEYAGILEGTDKPAESGLVLDFLLSEEFQVDIPGQMYMYPVSPTAALPALWESFPMPEVTSHNLPSRKIDRGRQGWIDDWTEVVLG